MEDHTTVDSTLAILHELRRDHPGTGAVLQSYLFRTEDDARDLAVAGSRVRLVKGAYKEPASVAFQDRKDVDKAYVRALRTLFQGAGYPMVGSHDPRMIAIAQELAARNRRTPDTYEFQMLYGIRTAEQRRLADEGERMRIYVPYGADWYGYFMRRLAERPANLAFFLRSFAPEPLSPGPTLPQGDTLHGRCDPGPRPGQRAGAHLRARQPGTRPARSQAQGAGREPGRPADVHRRRAAHGRRRARRRRPAAQPRRRAWAPTPTPPPRTRRTRSTPRSPPPPAWRAMSFDDRAAIILRAAELLAGPWRETIAASTMLGQSKTVQQAEIDSPCELVDFWRFNVHYARQILAEQPIANAPGVWNRLDHRPLEGFVYAITPFNFTAIAGNLPTAPALMGNVVVWKPSPTQTHSAVLLMQAAARRPGCPRASSTWSPATASRSPRSRWPTRTWPASTSPARPGPSSTCGARSARTSSATAPTRGSSARPAARTSSSPTRRADPAVLKTALTRGSFEYQGQKCSASSRAYIPRSIWESGFKEEFAAEVDGITMGDVTDLSNFIGAVIDERAFAKNKAAIDRAKADPTVEVVAGGTYDDSVGCFVRPTVLVSTDPANEIFREEYFGPVLGVYVYEDAEFDADARADGVRLRVRPDRRGHRPRPGGGRRRDGEAALRRGQLLHQRQVDRRGRRPAALRRRPGLRHQRQGGRRAEPDALDVHPLDQGDAASRPTDYRYPHQG